MIIQIEHHTRKNEEKIFFICIIPSFSTHREQCIHFRVDLFRGTFHRGQLLSPMRAPKSVSNLQPSLLTTRKRSRVREREKKINDVISMSWHVYNFILQFLLLLVSYLNIFPIRHLYLHRVNKIEDIKYDIMIMTYWTSRENNNKNWISYIRLFVPPSKSVSYLIVKKK